MVILVKIGQLLLSLSLLILLHELGHFLLAKRFGVRVEKFYLFFNPYFSLFRRKIGETEYGIGWLPLGGYVKLGGMIDESLDTEQMAAPPQPNDFRVKPAWQRLLIMLGGIFMNILVAWAIYSAILGTQGQHYIATKDARYGVAVEPLGNELGFQPGDRIVAVNGACPEDFAQIYPSILLTPDSRVTVKRGEQRVDVEIPRHALARMVNGEMPFTPRIPMVVLGVAPGSAAERAGFQAGDSLLALNGEKANFFDQFRGLVKSHPDSTITATVSREGTPITLSVQVPGDGIVGVQVVSDAARFFPVSVRRYGFFESLAGGATLGWRTLHDYAKSLKLLFVPEVKAYKSLGGFISIGNIFPGQWDWVAFWSLTAFLSIILAVMNVLPIPGLDGGHAMFLLFEMVTGRKVSERFLIGAQMVGMLLLLLLVIFANANDVIKLFN